jgi:hypothetical protein
MKAIEINGEIKTFSKYPKNFKYNDRLYLVFTDEKAKEIGFKDVVTPDIDYRIQKLSEIKLVGDVYTYDVIEKEITETIEELKANKIKQLKSIIGGKLSVTDWYVVRYADVGIEIPAAIKEARADLRDKSDILETEINALTTKKAVVLFDINL